MSSELGKLIADVKENLLFLQELGVSGLDVDADALQTQTQVLKCVPGAVSERVPPPAPTKAPVEIMREENKTPAPTRAPARSLRDTLDAAKLSGRSGGKQEKNGETASVPQRENPTMLTIKEEASAPESLFGEISPVNELPASNETLESIHLGIAGCKLCRLWEGRTQIVNSTGNPQAKLMFIGEAPGADEDAQGKPFVGRAGQLLTKIIEAMGMSRDEVFIGNINRCRPPGNRAPMADEAAMCKPFLLREIAVVRPKAIVVLGATAMQNLLETKAPIGKLRGNFQDYFGIRVMPTFHPAYLLRDPHKKREVWDDMKKVKAFLETL
jgi:uracil-DNA glycosylase family 4